MHHAHFGDLPSGKLSILLPSQASAVLDLFERCRDYFLLQDGEPAAAADADELFADVPSTKVPDDQFVIGCWQGEKLAGLAALLMDYPGKADWYLGFFLVDPAARGRGLGRTFYAAIERWSAEQGAKRMMLSVIEANVPALQFWRSLGFELVRTVEATKFKQKLHVRQELARKL